MEKRLNCYNYIFGTCNVDRCPYGHVVVNDKDDYLHKLESNDFRTIGRTSPKGIIKINFNEPIKIPIKYKRCICKICCKMTESYNSTICRDCEERLIHCSIDRDLIIQNNLKFYNL
jgi:hypothetical protein